MHSVFVNYCSNMFWPLNSWTSKGAHKFFVGQAETCRSSN